MSRMAIIARFIALLATVVISLPGFAEGLGDPMRPMSAPARSSGTHVAAPAQRVTAIFVSGDRRVAVFDGRVVKPGDRIGDVVIQDVMLDGVRIARGGRVEVLRLPKQAADVRSSVKDERKASIVKESSP